MFRLAPIPALMRPALILAATGLALLVPLAGLHADPDDRGYSRDYDDDTEREFDLLEQPGFRIIPLQDAVRRATDRFRGRLIAARLRPPYPEEEERGVELVHELRLLTPRRDVLLIRLDARTGDFLEVRGAGLAEARRKHGDDE
ncbi:PepSY domain-containing protein [Paracoccus sp. NGMCC 1.201697]|uniref:PepSY domain-containing protein n=1 Tax=Paracoccus broussonetiae subsp. drimophilus TaxID=3373869 RepID=A0ABW7LNL9_9RHOB